ncbi:Cyclic nucleotide-binding protein [Rhodospirillaceae bacterium LM-1]|nr:Cyclic nucleotide-binding protein [Rhodospirillaceae bacterium LM-1]
MKIRHIQVSRGVHWVEVQDRDLRILCGCPADSVKHLIKRGLIVPQAVKGVDCETGPNTILLSDLPLQNGEFANLAEFPVLQMLYKQGMILPNHPNNTGKRPMLIGLPEQVSAQMRYIYRGNYGLISKEEIMQAGFGVQQAEAMMRLKLKFAFGRIRPTEEFLEWRMLDDDPVELAEGVVLKRLRSNLFEFSFEDEKVVIDLNLSPEESYESAYPLGFRRYSPEYFAIIHSGEGDGWDVSRPSMSSIITYQGRLYLIDAGPNLSHILAALGIGIDQIDGIFHTHAHDDHFAGLTTLMRSGHRIRYFSTPLVRSTVAKKLAALLDTEEDRILHDYFKVHDLVFDQWNDIDGLEVKPIFSPHPVETNIFVFRSLWGDSYRSYAHFADIVSFDVLAGMVTDDEKAPGLSPADFEAVKQAYLTPADVKKIDIGGGLIHGAAKDFKADRSGRILLAHRSGDLTAEEKEIGSSAAFGTSDVLIEGQSEGLRRFAYSLMEKHLEGVPVHHLRTLLNHAVVEFNPGAIFLKEGDMPEDIVLVLSGTVEKIRTKDDVYALLSAGALIGGMAALTKRPSQHTYRAVSFVQALRFPLGLYVSVVRHNNLLDKMQGTFDLRSFLESTSLFGEGIPAVVMNRMIEESKTHRFKSGEIIPSEDMDVLNLIRKGRVERSAGGEVIEMLDRRSHFGEEEAIFKVPGQFRLKAVEETEVVQFPGDLLADVPIVRWKLFEGWQRRAKQAAHQLSHKGSFINWRDTFSVRIAHMDMHHKRLISIGNAVLENLRTDGRGAALIKAAEALADYVDYHFAAEEDLMALYDYPGISEHKVRHQDLRQQVSRLTKEIQSGSRPSEKDFKHLFESWIIHHVLGEDKAYGAFLNSKGIY